MEARTRALWGILTLLALLEGIFEFLPPEIGALLPIIYLSLPFYIFRNLQTGYRIFHLIFAFQFLLYALFITVFSYPDIVLEDGFMAAISYSQFTAVIFVYVFFLIVFGITYLPYAIIQKRKKSRTQ